MNFVFYCSIFLLGAAMASFFNLLGERLPREKKVIRGRSQCPCCGHRLVWRDLIPIFSWLFLAGRCRWCQKKISSQYLLGEIILGGIFVWIAWQNGLINFFIANGSAAVLINVIFLWLVSGALLAIFVADLKYFIIPDEMLWLIFILTILRRAAEWGLGLINNLFILETLAAALVLGGIFWLVYLAGQGKWLGFGDVKLFFVAGFLLGGTGSFLMILLASFAGSLVGLSLIIFRGKNLRTALPFGVFLAPAILAALLFGEKMVDWCLELIRF